MRPIARVGKSIAAGALAAGLLLTVPSGASAAQSCLFQGLKVSAKNQDRVEASLLCLTNLHRVRNGLAALPRDARLAAAARAHSADMQARGFFDHLNPEGAEPTARAAAFGYPFGVGENLATNVEGTALQLISQWKGSAGHSMNMLLPYTRALGVGVVTGCCPSGHVGAVGTQMVGVGPANSQYTGLDLYASSKRCAKAKLAVIKGERALRKAKRKGSRKLPRLRDRLRMKRKAVKRICKPV